jgi:hypothetical protein
VSSINALSVYSPRGLGQTSAEAEYGEFYERKLDEIFNEMVRGESYIADDDHGIYIKKKILDVYWEEFNSKDKGIPDLFDIMSNIEFENSSLRYQVAVLDYMYGCYGKRSFCDTPHINVDLKDLTEKEASEIEELLEMWDEDFSYFYNYCGDESMDHIIEVLSVHNLPFYDNELYSGERINYDADIIIFNDCQKRLISWDEDLFNFTNTRVI